MIIGKGVKWSSLVLSSLALAACSLFSSEQDEDKEKEKEKEKIQQGSYNPNFPTGERSIDELSMTGNNPTGQSLRVTTSEQLEKIDNQAEGPVFFTDPDNPDADIEGISVAFEGARQRMSWLTKLSYASKVSRRERLPLIIWFHDSLLSPKSKAMAKDLFETPEFLAWMKGKAIGVRLDSSAGYDESGMQSDKADTQNVRAIRQRYGVKHIPTFVVVSATGEVVEKIDASDGFIAGASLEIREAVAQAQRLYDFHREELKAKGYREWVNARGDRKIFAKLRRFDRSKDIVYLIEESGKPYKLKLFDFSAKDIEYLDALPKKSTTATPRSR